MVQPMQRGGEITAAAETDDIYPDERGSGDMGMQVSSSINTVEVSEE